MIRKFVVSVPLFIAASAAGAVDAPQSMQTYVESEVMGWAHDANVISAITAQNAQTAGASADQIDAWDSQWRAEVGQADQPLISDVMGRPLSAFLSDQVAASGGRITELFVMDAMGLNVAASDVTSDYWQGDEDKFSKTYGVGAGSIFVDEVEFDESSQTYQGQISVALTDPATGEVIGAMTIGLNAEAFF